MHMKLSNKGWKMFQLALRKTNFGETWDKGENGMFAFSNLI